MNAIELLNSPIYLLAQFFGLCSIIISLISQQFKLREKILIAFIFANLFKVGLETNQK